MERRERPSVMITTYASCKSTNQIEQVATRADRSTDLFRCRAKSRVQADLSQIKGPSGSVRGHRDVVRRSLANIKQQTSFPQVQAGNRSLGELDEMRAAECLARLADEEQERCVAYTTSLGVIRKSFDDSKRLRSILELNLIKFEERDIYLNQEYKHQLLLRCQSIQVPALFVDGRFLGGVKELDALNESGQLAPALAKFKMPRASTSVCRCCGNARFIACQSCNGSRRSAIHHFRFNSVALRCIRCSANEGLTQCPRCSLDEDENNNIQTVEDCNKLDSKY